MIHIILGSIIIGLLCAIAAIVIRAFPRIANLDVTTLAEERETSKKREIIAKRAVERSHRLRQAWSGKLAPLIKQWRKLQLRFRVYVGRIERLWYHEQARLPRGKGTAAAAEGQERRYEYLVAQGQQMFQQKKYEQAEELFINAIRLDQHESTAYRGLADAYGARGSLTEARETYQYVLRLMPDDDATMVKLAEMAEQRGDIEEAISYYQQAVVANDALSPRFYHLGELLLRVKQPEIAKEAVLSAVELEPKNPKYLDLLIEIAILCNDKEMANYFYNELRLVNPDNQRLDNFKSRISQI